MVKKTSDIGTPTVLVRYQSATPEDVLENRRCLETAISNVVSKQKGFPIRATVEWKERPVDYGETRICRGEEIVFPDRENEETLPEWAVKALDTFSTARRMKAV